MTSDTPTDDAEFESTNTENRTHVHILLGLLAACATAIFFDVGVYRGFGFSGWAFFFIGTVLSYWVATLRTRSHTSSWLIFILISVLVTRLAWSGTGFQCFLGVLLIAGYAMTRNGYVPELFTWWLYLLQSTIAGFATIRVASRFSPKVNRQFKPASLLAIGLPAIAVFVFGGIFIAANPDLGKWAESWVHQIEEWFERTFSTLNPQEFIIFMGVFWIALGQIRPLSKLSAFGTSHALTEADVIEEDSVESVMYFPFRNTLIAVTGLFGLYLVFEFQTLWFRQFPEGFYYAGYAHKGAAWLTFALALATATLSLIFRGAILRDPRLSQLRKFAWLWSAANLLLALAVYNRLLIYVQFNGMTRMRMLGLYGVTTVVVGFLLVVWKIRYQQTFAWLIQRQLWTVSLAIFLLTMTPVDYLIHSYNTSEILDGDLAPSVQITEHPVSISGWLALVPLLECEDEIIRSGVREKLTTILQNDGYLTSSRHNAPTSNPNHWTAYQLVREQLLIALRESNLNNSPRISSGEISDWERFRQYAFQWY